MRGTIPARLVRPGRGAPPPPRYPYGDAQAARPVLFASRWPVALPCSGPRPAQSTAARPARRHPAGRSPAAPGPASPLNRPPPQDRRRGLPWEDGAVAEDAAAALLPVASDAEEKLEDKDEDEAGPLPSLHGTPAPARC